MHILNIIIYARANFEVQKPFSIDAQSANDKPQYENSDGYKYGSTLAPSFRLAAKTADVKWQLRAKCPRNILSGKFLRAKLNRRNFSERTQPRPFGKPH